MTSGSEITKRVEGKRREITERMEEIEQEHEALKVEYAELEAQHKWLDELIGDGNSDPFEQDESSEPGQADPGQDVEPSASSPSEPKPKSKPGPHGQPLPMKPPGGKSAGQPRKYGHGDGHPKISAREMLDMFLKELLEKHPDKWLTVGAIKSRIEQDHGVQLPSGSRVAQLLKKFVKDDFHPWLRCSATAKKSHSLHPKHGGTALSMPDKSNTLR